VGPDVSSPVIERPPKPELREGSAARRTDHLLGLQRAAGNRAVTGLFAPRQGAVQRQKTGSKPSGPPGIVVHPSSSITAAQLVAMLKKHPDVPDTLKKSLAVSGRAIVIRGRDPQKPPGTFSEYLAPFIAAVRSPGWQITTARSTIKVTGTPPSRTYSQVVTPHLSKNQQLGTTLKTGPGQTTFMADTLYSNEKQVIYGWTVPASSTEQLKLGRGLIVTVTSITVVLADGRTRTFTPTESQVLEAVIHEIAAHAGRITQGLPDVHGVRDVENIAEEVGKFFRYSAGSSDLKPGATTSAIIDFIEGPQAP
jgi:hypothetical protein